MGCGGDVVSRDIPNTNEITTFLHCSRCFDALQGGAAPDLSPREFTEFEVGFTELGLQIWCRRHDCNVVHIDFEGCQHPANETRVAPSKLRGI